MEFDKNKPVESEDNEVLLESLKFKLYFEENLHEYLRIHKHEMTVSEVRETLQKKYERTTLKEKALYKKKAKIVVKKDPDIALEQVENDLKSLLDNRPFIVNETVDEEYTPSVNDKI